MSNPYFNILLVNYYLIFYFKIFYYVNKCENRPYYPFYFARHSIGILKEEVYLIYLLLKTLDFIRFSDFYSSTYFTCEQFDNQTIFTKPLSLLAFPSLPLLPLNYITIPCIWYFSLSLLTSSLYNDILILYIL